MNFPLLNLMNAREKNASDRAAAVQPKARRDRWSPFALQMLVVIATLLSPVVAYWLNRSEQTATSRSVDSGESTKRNLSLSTGPLDSGNTSTEQRPVSGDTALDNRSLREVAASAMQEEPNASNISQSGIQTLTQGQALTLPDPGVTVAVTFDKEFGGTATIRIQPSGGDPIVQAMLGPGGQIPFNTAAGEYNLSILDWNPDSHQLFFKLTEEPSIGD